MNVKGAEVKAWIDSAREYIVHWMERTGQETVSVNDLFKAIMEGKCPAPPSKAGLTKRGQAMCAVFQGAPYFYPTGIIEAAVNPASKKRRVLVWGLNRAALPIVSRRAKLMLSDCREWA